jgi:NAD(P)-dependent dehydrogenase (short-subunit alcohol dehydrogenase family)
MDSLFDISGKTAVITGGKGIIAAAIAKALAQRGVNLALLDRSADPSVELIGDIEAAGGRVICVPTDVLVHEELTRAAEEVLQSFGRIDFLINAAGGNKKNATTSADLSFFQLPQEDLRQVIDLNLLGTVLPSQVFGAEILKQGQGVIINISSMNSFRPLTRIVGYSAAKAAVNNFTQWLAVDVARNYSPKIRVNAIAPGFILTKQNEFLLLDSATGKLTERGETIIKHTPMGCFGTPEDMVGPLLWLLSPAASFVTGVVLPIDGGFSAYSGV